MQVIEKSTSVYMLPNGIYINTFKDVWERLINKKKLYKQYVTKKKSEAETDYIDFINEEVYKGTISVDDISEVLENALVYGKHKSIQIYDIDVMKKYKVDQFIDDINSKYDVNNGFNELAILYEYEIDKKLDTIAYLKIVDLDAENIVKYVRMIFVRKVKKDIKGMQSKYENSYFPIDIDFVNKKMIVRYYDKDYLNGDYRGEVIANYYANEVINLLDINFSTSRQMKYQKALYEICDGILNSVINEKSRMIVEDIDDIVKELSESFKSRLSSSIDIEYLWKTYKKNIFNMNDQIYKFIENMCISKIIYESNSDELTSVEGLISYITYKESGAVRAIIKNPKRAESLLDSQSYLNLRNVLAETRYIEEIKVLWNRQIDVEKIKKILVKYDATKLQYISIKFYSKYDEGDLNYVRQKFNSFC